MAVDCGEHSNNDHSVVVLPEREASNLHCKPLQTDFHVEVSNAMDDLLTDRSPKMESYESCILSDVDIEEGKGEICTEESIRLDDSWPQFLVFKRGLQRDMCLPFGGRLMHFLINHIPQLPKFTSRDKFVAAERGYDTSSNRARKYKRSKSFNSRRVVLMFSVLSSVGTLILILLTLRMWLMSGGSVVSFEHTH